MTFWQYERVRGMEPTGFEPAPGRFGGPRAAVTLRPHDLHTPEPTAIGSGNRFITELSSNQPGTLSVPNGGRERRYL